MTWTPEQQDMIAKRANRVMAREQDRCAFKHFIKIAIDELCAEGEIPPAKEPQ